MNKIAIVGAGLLGRLLAWRLALKDQQVCLFESGSFTQQRSAAYTAAAMVSPFSEAIASNKTIFAIGKQSLALWPQWIRQLNQQVHHNNRETVNYDNPGTLVVAHAQDISELQQFKQDLQGILQAEDASQWLNQGEIESREADLYPFHRALYLPEEAYLDNRQLLSNLLILFKSMGGKCYEHQNVSAINQPSGNYNPSNYDVIIDCRGMGAKKDWQGLRGVRGEVMWVHCPELNFKHAIRLMHPRYKLYLVPKPNHHYIIGATEIESEDVSPISLQSNLELASALYSINPVFAEARIVETDVNLRPAFVDNEPKIKIDNNIIRINGLHRHGYLLAPTMVDDIANWITSQNTGHYWEYFLGQSNALI